MPTEIEPPLIYERFDEDIAHGYSWCFGDEDLLANYVAKLLLGQHRHVRKILEGVSTPTPTTSEEMIRVTLQKLAPESENPKTLQKLKELRDGWLFQLMAWVGIRLVDSGKILISPPHDRPADKGFDALVIVLEEGARNPASMMICEEKATDRARNLFQQQVLNEFKECKDGKRDTEIKSELTTLLESSHVDEALVDGFLELVMWKRERSYRVSLTTTGINPDEKSRKKLFKNFDDIIPGPASLRRAEMFQFDNLRLWMDCFSVKVANEIDKMRGEE